MPSWPVRPTSFQRKSISVDFPVPGSPDISRNGILCCFARICSANKVPNQKASDTMPLTP
ncbi:hypothetical protein [Lysobacter gummosus]|uniref:hypothetical protein n=1 Tax=Lysobacter gummosus TaxID=262324 RepID=UPI00363FD127